MNAFLIIAVDTVSASTQNTCGNSLFFTGNCWIAIWS